MLYVKMLLIKRLKFLGYRSSLSLQTNIFNGDGKVYSKYPRINILNFNIKFKHRGGINYYKGFL